MTPGSRKGGRVCRTPDTEVTKVGSNRRGLRRRPPILGDVHRFNGVGKAAIVLTNLSRILDRQLQAGLSVLKADGARHSCLVWNG